MKKSINHYSKNPDDYQLDDEIYKSFNNNVNLDDSLFTPSLISEVCITELQNGKETVIKRNTDVNLLLRQKNIAEKLGSDTLRSILNDVNQNLMQQGNTDDTFSDEQLFALTRDRRINNMTDSYQLTQFINDNYKSLKDAQNQRLELDKKLEEQRKEFVNLFNNKSE